MVMASRAVCRGVVSPGGALFMEGPMSSTIAMASCKIKFSVNVNLNTGVQSEVPQSPDARLS